jgi:hypothetical protein
MYDRSAALARAPRLIHGSVQPHFRQRICQPGARFLAAMTFSAVILGVESPALMSGTVLHLSASTGELFFAKEIPRRR